MTAPGLSNVHKDCCTEVIDCNKQLVTGLENWNQQKSSFSDICVVSNTSVKILNIIGK